MNLRDSSYSIATRKLLPSKRSFSNTSSLLHRRPAWQLSGNGVQFPTPKLPEFPQQYSKRVLEKGEKIEKGVPLRIFIDTVSQKLKTFMRRNRPDHSQIVDEIYTRRLNHYHSWNSEVGTRRFRLRNGNTKNIAVEFGQPNLRGERLRQLWIDLHAIDWERQRATKQGTSQLGFDRNIESLESEQTKWNRQLEINGMIIIRKRNEDVNRRINRSNLFHYVI